MIGIIDNYDNNLDNITKSIKIFFIYIFKLLPGNKKTTFLHKLFKFIFNQLIYFEFSNSMTVCSTENLFITIKIYIICLR